MGSAIPRKATPRTRAPTMGEGGSCSEQMFPGLVEHVRFSAGHLPERVYFVPQSHNFLFFRPPSIPERPSMSLHTIAIFGSSATFLIYGGLCLSSLSMQGEFKRFGLERLRTLTGLLEVLGGVGLLVGLKWPLALWLSSGGLSLLMMAGLGVRIRIGDSLLISFPALALMILNAYILIASLK